MPSLPALGDIWLVSLDPAIGHEQAGTRPALVISVDQFNHGPAGLAIVIPITSRNKGLSLHVGIDPPEGGLNLQSFAMPENLRSISVDRMHKRLDAVSSDTMDKLRGRLRILMDL